MILSSKDILVVAASIAVITAGSAGLYIDYTSRISSNRTDLIGTITFKKKTAERKYNDQMIWEDIGQEAPLYNNDTIRTAEDSSAVVKLSDGTKIDLDENTLVMLSVTAAGADIDLAGGSIFAKTGNVAGKGPVNIRSGGTSVAVQGGELNLTKTADKALDVSVSSGSATVTGVAGPVSVGPNQSVQVAAGKAEMKKTVFTLDAPAPNAYVLRTGAGKADIVFVWKGGEGGKTAVEIASDRAFTGKIDKKPGRSGLRQSLGKGNYYWRVTGADGESEIRKFSVIEDSMVLPLSPSEGEAVSFRKSNPQISFSWSASSYASSYKVEISGFADFSRIVQTLTSSSTSITTDTLPEGIYFWRVFPVYDFMNPQLSAKAMSFKISRSKEFPSPDPVFPDDGAKIGSGVAAGGGLSFGWKRQPESDRYMLEIASDQSFRQIIATEPAAANFVSKRLPSAEKMYYWRVSGHAADGSVSAPSAPRSFSVIKTRPPAALSVSQEGSAGVFLKWKDPDSLGRYRVEISKDRNFSSAVRSLESSMLSVAVDDLAQGDYVWRVSSLDPKGLVAGTSEASPLSISGKLVSPLPLSPVDNVSIDIRRIKNIEFKWQGVRDATVYELEIHQYSFVSDKLMLKTEVTGDKYSVNKFSVLASGNLYWQVCAVRKSGNDVLARSAPAKGFFNILSGPDLKAPKIGNMKVYVE